MKQRLPYLIAFTLPLGFGGIVGVIGVFLYAAMHLPRLLSLDRGPLYAALPLAIVTVVAAALSPDPGSSLPPAVGLAMLLTVGLQAARLVAQDSQAKLLISAFVLGTNVLALSIAVDFALGINRIPSGLFRDPTLHNWAGTLLALAFPLALYLADQRGSYRIFGMVSAVVIFFGNALALSWVGFFGLLAGAIAYGIISRRVYGWVLLISLILAAATFNLWKTAFDDALYDLRVRGFSLATWEHVFTERLVIYREGMQLALQRPWLGWGYSSHHPNLAAIPGLIEARAALRARPQDQINLLQASEAFDRLPWRGWHARAIGNVTQAPDGSSNADLTIGENIAGHRIFQFVQLPAHVGSTYTFSVWARSQTGQHDFALAVRDADGRAANVAAFSTGLDARVLDTRAVRFLVGESWQRLWLTAEFQSPPEDAVLVLLYLDGFFNGHSARDSFYLWGAQLNEGAEVLAYVPVAIAGLVLIPHHLSHFHNWFSQTLFATGLLGLLALAGVLAWLYFNMNSRLSTPAKAALLALIAAQMFDYAMSQASILASLCLVCAVGLGPTPKHKFPTLLPANCKQ